MNMNTVPYPGIVIELGSRNPAVRALQTYLLALSEVYDSIPPVEVSGVFGVATRDAVMAAQELFNIEPSGIVGALTWNAIAGEYNDIFESRMVNEGQYPGYEIS